MSPPSGAMDRRAAAVLAAASLLVLASAPAQYLGRQHDDILFVIASHALSYGRYALFTSPGSPPLVHVWPGLPVLLLPVTWIAGEWTPAYQLFSALILAACPWALWFWLRRRLEPTSALLAPLVFVSSPLVLSQAGCVMPEAPCALLAVLLLLLLDEGKVRDREASWLLAALTLIRPAALSVVPAVTLRWVLTRRWREVARLSAPAGVGVAGWLLWCLVQGGRVHEAGEWVTSFQGHGISGIVLLPLANLRFYLNALGSSWLPLSWGGGPVAWVLGAGLGGVSLAGLARLLRRDAADPAALMLATAVVMHLLFGWQYERYLIPLLPLLLLCACVLLGRRAPRVLGALLGAQLVFHAPRFLGESPVSKPELSATYAWLQECTAPADVFASALYARDGFYAGRPALPLADAQDAGALADLLQKWKVRHVVWQEGLDLGLSLGPAAAPRRALDQLATQLGDRRWFRPAFNDAQGGATVYEVLQPR